MTMESDFDRLSVALAGRYTLVREVGQGGMATVYLATEEQHRRSVAIKVLDSSLANLLGRQRFVREVEVVSRLNHPNIVPIFAAGEADGLLYYVMPFIEGFTVRHRLVRDGPLPARDALRICQDVAGALAHAHDRGVVHRDIKPENILLSDGRPVVADFGIAKAVLTAGGDTLTRTGLVVGTPRYMSPEQAGGATVDGRADIYALGRVLYEMLVGDVPPDREHEFEQGISALPPRVATVLRRALAIDAHDRYGHARDLEHELEEAAATLTDAHRTRSRSLSIRSILLAVLVAALAVLLVVAAVTVL